MAYTAGDVKAKFTRLLNSLTPQNVAKDPLRDFSRNRLLTIKDVVLSLILLGRDCLDTEMRRLFRNWKEIAPTKSAFVQQRAKLSADALPYVFRELNSLFPFKITLNGVHILAADGTDQNVPPDGKDSPSFILYNSKKGGYYQNHINTVYDVLECRFVDVLIQPRKEMNEADALYEMVRRNPIEGICLYIMDRGFNCFNLMATIRETGNYFMVRAKDVGSGSILDCFNLPKEEEFDENLCFYISKSKKSRFKEEVGFKFIQPSKQRFDYLDPSDPTSTYELPFRLVKIKLGKGNYEYLITNLPKEKFPVTMMKHLYHLRWDTEEAYFMLKYKANLVYHHSRKQEYIIQETYARLILYNLTNQLVSGVTVNNDKERKYKYKINITQAFVTCRMLFGGELCPSQVEKELLRYLVPIRNGRSYGRDVRSQRLVPMNNRN